MCVQYLSAVSVSRSCAPYRSNKAAEEQAEANKKQKIKLTRNAMIILAAVAAVIGWSDFYVESDALLYVTLYWI